MRLSSKYLQGLDMIVCLDEVGYDGDHDDDDTHFKIPRWKEKMG